MTSAVMMPPAELKQYKADLAIVQAALASSLAYLHAEERLVNAADELRQRWLDARECGAALQRIHDNEGYRDHHKDFSAFCRSLKPAISRQHVYRLMKCAEILAEYPTSLVGRIDMPLSFRLVDELGEIDEDVWQEIVEAAATDEDAAFERLRETLQKTREAKAAAPPAAKEPKGIEWAKKHTAAIEKFIRELGEDEIGLPLLNALNDFLEKALVRRKAA